MKKVIDINYGFNLNFIITNLPLYIKDHNDINQCIKYQCEGNYYKQSISDKELLYKELLLYCKGLSFQKTEFQKWDIVSVIYPVHPNELYHSINNSQIAIFLIIRSNENNINYEIILLYNDQIIHCFNNNKELTFINKNDEEQYIHQMCEIWNKNKLIPTVTVLEQSIIVLMNNRLEQYFDIKNLDQKLFLPYLRNNMNNYRSLNETINGYKNSIKRKTYIKISLGVIIISTTIIIITVVVIKKKNKDQLVQTTSVKKKIIKIAH